MPTQYYVKDGHTLGYIDDRQPNSFGVLAGKPQLGGHDSLQGYVQVSRLDVLRPATLADFEFFRVSPKGHMPKSISI